ncbi:MAG: hypothetical protein ACRD1V_19415 [Vicinamibacterales bacterium]
MCRGRPVAAGRAAAREPVIVRAGDTVTYEVKLKEVKNFYDGGGAKLITSGTDHLSWGEYLAGFGTHRELNAFVPPGACPAAAAIKMATINAAHAMHFSDALDMIEPGRPEPKR